MGVRDLGKALGKTVAVGIATTGLTTCGLGGVDPAPPPGECRSDDDNRALQPTAQVSGDTLTVEILPPPGAVWASVTVNEVVGATLVAANLDPNHNTVAVILALHRAGPPDGGVADGGVSDGGVSDGGVSDGGGIDAAMSTDGGGAPPDLGAQEVPRTGSFKLHGVIDRFGTDCGVARTFDFQVAQGIVLISDLLPLSARQQTTIAILHRDGSELHLEARSPFVGTRAVAWSVSGGEILARAGERLHWRLPPAPGLYHVELLMDYGDRGFAIDSLSFEVT